MGEEELEAALENVDEEEEEYTIEKEEISDKIQNNKNYNIDNIIFSRANYKTKIPLPIGKVIKARRRLNLSSYENDLEFYAKLQSKCTNIKIASVNYLD